jgi:hypothetical protein
MEKGFDIYKHALDILLATKTNGLVSYELVARSINMIKDYNDRLNNSIDLVNNSKPFPDHPVVVPGPGLPGGMFGNNKTLIEDSK